jgi:hypothetical protein
MDCERTAIASLVVVASLVRDTVLLGVLVDGARFAALAAAGLATVDHLLHGQVGRRPGVLTTDVDAVGQCAGRAHRPTRTAVCKSNGRSLAWRTFGANNGVHCGMC